MKKWFENVPIMRKLTVMSIAFVIVPVAVVAYVSLHMYSCAVEKIVAQDIQSLQKDRAQLISDFLERSKDESRVFGQMPSVLQAMKDYAQAYKQAAQEGTAYKQSTAYEAAQAKHDAFLRMIVRQLGHVNVHLIDGEGNVLYTIIPEVHFGKNLFKSGLRDTSVAKMFTAFRQGTESAVSDLEIGNPDAPPEKYEYVLYAGAPIVENGQMAGMIVFEIGIEEMLESLTDTTGLGKTGAVYLVGADMTLRTRVRTASGETGVPLKTKADIEPVRLALQGQSGVILCKGINKREAYCAYAPLRVGGLEWVIVAEMPKSEAMASAGRSANWTLLIAFVSVGLVIAVVALVTRNITRPITALANIARSMAERDLTVQISSTDRRDEIGQLYNSFRQMMTSMRTIIERAQGAAIHITSSSTEISAAAEQQASSATEMATQMNEIASTITENASIARELAQSMEQVQGTVQEVGRSGEQVAANASQGQQIMDQAIASMEKITEVVEDTNRLARELGDQSQRIGKIVNTVSAIANKTDLLSLNAAIEAVKAGEHGEGFAVVASEVRSLANQTSDALKEIENLVDSIQTSVQRTVLSMETGAQATREGRERVQTAYENFREITSQIEEVANRLHDISQAISEQTTATGELRQGTSDMEVAVREANEAIQSVAQAARDTAESVQDFRALVDQLRQAISQFTLPEDSKA